MTKFLEALVIQLDPERRKKAEIPKLIAEPVYLTQEVCGLDSLDRYLLTLNWNFAIWMNTPTLDSQLEQARLEAISCLKGLIYGEIHSKLAEIKFMVKRGDTEEAVQCIQELMVDIMT
jgi:hypothetical protein